MISILRAVKLYLIVVLNYVSLTMWSWTYFYVFHDLCIFSGEECIQVLSSCFQPKTSCIFCKLTSCQIYVFYPFHNYFFHFLDYFLYVQSFLLRKELFTFILFLYNNCQDQYHKILLLWSLQRLLWFQVAHFCLWSFFGVILFTYKIWNYFYCFACTYQFTEAAAFIAYSCYLLKIPTVWEMSQRISN